MSESGSRIVPSQTPTVVPVLLVNFIGTLGFSIVLPFLVFLVTRFGGNAFVYGLVGATYPAFQLVGAPLLGAWSDRYGRRRILLLSQAGTLASWIVFAAAIYLPSTTLFEVESAAFGTFGVSLPLLAVFAARALDGLTGGNISVANAYLADVSSESDRARNFGLMGVSSNLGFVLGPALASLLAAVGPGEVLPVFAALLISLVATVLIATALPESRPRGIGEIPARRGSRRALGQEPVDCTRVPQSRRVGLNEVARVPMLRALLVLYFTVFLGFSLFYVAFPVRAASDLGWTVGQTGVFFAVLSGMMIVVQGPVLASAVKKVSERTLVVVGSVLLALNFVLLTSDRSEWIFAAAVLFATGNGLMWPTVQAVLSRSAGERLQGAAQGFAGAAGSLASILGLLFGGVLYQTVGTSTFLVAAGVLILSGGLGARLCVNQTVGDRTARPSPR